MIDLRSLGCCRLPVRRMAPGTLGCSRLPTGPTPTPHEGSGARSLPNRCTSSFYLGRPKGLRTGPHPLQGRLRTPRRAPTPRLASTTGDGGTGKNAKTDSWTRSAAGSGPLIKIEQPSGLPRARPLEAPASPSPLPPPLPPRRHRCLLRAGGGPRGTAPWTTRRPGPWESSPQRSHAWLPCLPVPSVTTATTASTSPWTASSLESDLAQTSGRDDNHGCGELPHAPHGGEEGVGVRCWVHQVLRHAGGKHPLWGRPLRGWGLEYVIVVRR